LKFWNLFAENIFNTAMIQADYKQPLSSDGDFFTGIQVIQQNKVGKGGNEDLSKRYVQDKSSTTYGGTIGWENKSWKTSFNYNRITATGRYLMPREWGRDPFYTFMSRERNTPFQKSISKQQQQLDTSIFPILMIQQKINIVCPRIPSLIST
jgi:hypothetical protein